MSVRVSKRFFRIATVAAIAMASACNDGPTAVKLSDIVGTWDLIHLNRTSATTGETIDAMADGNSSMTMTISADSTLTTVTVTDGGAPVNGTGTIAVSGNKTGFKLDGQQFYCNIFLAGSQLTIDCGEQDGIAEYSRITFIWAKI